MLSKEYDNYLANQVNHPALRAPLLAIGGELLIYLNTMHNYKHLEQNRKSLRNNSTSAEASLWKHLSKRQLGGRKFRRQHSIGKYIVDFFCPSERLIIELDGEIHNNPSAQKKDKIRDAYFKNLNYHVIRFENKMVFDNLPSVLREISEHFEKTI